MKNNKLKLLMMICLGLGSIYTYAQEQKEVEKSIKIEKTEDGEVKVIESEGMTEEEINAIIADMDDSLHEGNKVMEFSFDTDEDFTFDDDKGHNYVFKHGGNKGPQIHIRKKIKGSGNEWEDLHMEMKGLGNEMKVIHKEFKHQMGGNMPQIYSWQGDVFTEMSHSAIRSLDVYPNKPDSDVINVRFYAPEEGDISITVLDAKGKLVAQKEQAEFKGEFVGQIKLKKGVKGAHFVIVSQGDDGESRKVQLD